MAKKTDPKEPKANQIDDGIEPLSDDDKALIESMERLAGTFRHKFFRASHHTADCVFSNSMQPLSEIELRSVQSLLIYAAHNQNASADTIQMMLETKFNVSSVARIRQKDYENVIRFLVDLKLDEILN